MHLLVQDLFELNNEQVYEHYVVYTLGNNGKSKGEFRDTSPFLNLEVYNDYTDLKNMNAMQLSLHYLLYGSRMEGRRGSNSVEAAAFVKVYDGTYALYNKDVRDIFGEGKSVSSANQLWDHFWIYAIAKNESRISSSNFNMSIYKSRYHFSSSYEAFWNYINKGYSKNQKAI